MNKIWGCITLYVCMRGWLFARPRLSILQNGKTCAVFPLIFFFLSNERRRNSLTQQIAAIRWKTNLMVTNSKFGPCLLPLLSWYYQLCFVQSTKKKHFVLSIYLRSPMPCFKKIKYRLCLSFLLFFLTIYDIYKGDTRFSCSLLYW